MMLKGKKILIGVTGSIAAYKICDLVRRLRKQNAEVHVILTESGEKFIGRATFEALSGNPAATDMWTSASRISHIELAQEADLLVIAPATANIMAKAANGICDDLLSTVIIARRSPIMFVPAMNRYMWENAATQRNVSTLKSDGALFCGPASGEQACGDVGSGRMTEPEDIEENVIRFFHPKKLCNKKVLMTIGPTFEAIDPVRGLTNSSSGRQGWEIALAAARSGAAVTAVYGPCNKRNIPGVSCISVQSADEMFSAVKNCIDNESPDVFIGVAAVCDFRPTAKSGLKWKKGTCPTAIELSENRDILAFAGSEKKIPLVVGFAAETDHLLENAQKKLKNKGADLIVANGAETIGSFQTEAIFVTADSAEPQGLLTKAELAERLISKISALTK
jgi:phosphopantothenoylcysteine decarboxylase/phosphopantothenate--cysteine ligase